MAPTAKIKRCQKSNLYTQPPLYRDTDTNSTLVSNDGLSLSTHALLASSTSVASRDSKCEDSEAIKSLKKLVGDGDGVKVARLGRVLLKLYSLEQKNC